MHDGNALGADAQPRKAGAGGSPSAQRVALLEQSLQRERERSAQLERRVALAEARARSLLEVAAWGGRRIEAGVRGEH